MRMAWTDGCGPTNSQRADTYLVPATVSGIGCRRRAAPYRAGSQRLRWPMDREPTNGACKRSNEWTTVSTQLIRRLRRYACAMSGSTALGDLCIAQALQAAIDKTDVPFDCWTEIKAYASVTSQIRAWLGNGRCGDADAPIQTGNLAAALQALRFSERASLVLHCLEDFAPAQIAAILRCQPDDAASWIAQAQGRIEHAWGTTVLILEDNVLTARTLTETVTDLGCHVVGIARDATSAFRIAESAAPNLVLADLRLADGASGVNAARRIADTGASRVVVVTGHPDMLDQADRSEFPVVAKPFAPSVLRQAIWTVLAA